MGISPGRKIVSAVMLSLSGVCTLLVIGVLFFILGYLLIHGVKSLDLDFFTKLPKPSGETGGGMANAIVGSAKVLMVATLIGVPIGFLAGVFLAEYSGKAFAFTIRYVVDLLNGVPSIVVGIVAYALVVRPMRHYSALAGGVALGIMMIPDSRENHRRISALCAEFDAGGCHGTWRHQGADDFQRSGAGCNVRADLGNDAKSGARGGRDRASSYSLRSATCFGARDGWSR